MKQFFQDQDGQLSSKRLIALSFSLATLIFIFFFESHPHYEVTLAYVLGFVSALLGVTAFEKTVKKDDNQPPKTL